MFPLIVLVVVVRSFVEEKQSGIGISSIITIMKQFLLKVFVCFFVLFFVLDRRMRDARQRAPFSLRLVAFLIMCNFSIPDIF